VRDFAAIASTRIAILANNKTMKTTRGHTSRVLDQTVGPITRNSDNTRHAPVFPFTRHPADRFKRICVVAVINHHVTAVQFVEIHTAGIVRITRKLF
jgi:hypothetical protein